MFVADCLGKISLGYRRSWGRGAEMAWRLLLMGLEDLKQHDNSRNEEAGRPETECGGSVCFHMGVFSLPLAPASPFLAESNLSHAL